MAIRPLAGGGALTLDGIGCLVGVWSAAAQASDPAVFSACLRSISKAANTCGVLTHATRANHAVARAIRSEVRLRLNEQDTYAAGEELTRASAHSQRALLVMATGSDESTTQRIMLHRSVLALIKAASRIGEIA